MSPWVFGIENCTRQDWSYIFSNRFIGLYWDKTKSNSLPYSRFRWYKLKIESGKRIFLLGDHRIKNQEEKNHQRVGINQNKRFMYGFRILFTKKEPVKEQDKPKIHTY